MITPAQAHKMTTADGEATKMTPHMRQRVQRPPLLLLLLMSATTSIKYSLKVRRCHAHV
jgi:hypothetical protein